MMDWSRREFLTSIAGAALASALPAGGVMPTFAAMVTKPLYHGAINIHGAAPSPDSRLLACTGRGTSNVYLVDLETMKVIGNTPNPQAGSETNAERITSG